MGGGCWSVANAVVVCTLLLQVWEQLDEVGEDSDDEEEGAEDGEGEEGEDQDGQPGTLHPQEAPIWSLCDACSTRAC